MNVVIRVLLIAFVSATANGCAEAPPSTQVDSAEYNLVSLLQILTNDNENFPSPSAPVFPEGFLPQGEAHSESFSINALLNVSQLAQEQTETFQLSLVARIDRLALRPLAASAKEDSKWRYLSVLRSNVAVDVFGDVQNNSSDNSRKYDALLRRLAESQPLQTLQRGALGLAGSNQHSVWVNNDQITVLFPNEKSPECGRQYQWQLQLTPTDRLHLQFDMELCPNVLSIAQYHSWEQPVVSLSGTLVSSIESEKQTSMNLEGVAWIGQSFGKLPDLQGGAVVIDTAQIFLQDSGWLEVSRSKRRSGRGPKTVVATLRDFDGLKKEMPLEWHDDSNWFALINEEEGINLKVEWPNRSDENNDISGATLHEPVRVSGTDEGAGFLSFNSLTE